MTAEANAFRLAERWPWGDEERIPFLAATGFSLNLIIIRQFKDNKRLAKGAQREIPSSSGSFHLTGQAAGQINIRCSYDISPVNVRSRKVTSKTRDGR